MNSSRESAAREHTSTLEIEDANSNGTLYKCGCQIWKQFGGPWSITQCSTHAARAREVQELVKAAERIRAAVWDGADKPMDVYVNLRRALAPFAAKGETDSVAAQGEQHE